MLTNQAITILLTGWQAPTLNNFWNMKALYLIIFLLGFEAASAHNPDIASLMMYEQNGKSILLIKSSLTAFEGEVNYIFGKDAYKTPEAFNDLVIQHFKNNCFVVANGDTLRFSNIQVQLGHETNLFAELENVPTALQTLYVSNTVFKDMSNNKCELIITLNGFPQKQFVLDNNNYQAVMLKVENMQWVVAPADTVDSNKSFLMLFWIIAIVLMVAFVLFKNRYRLFTFYCNPQT